MQSYKFTVDRELNLRTWDKNLERIRRKMSSEVAGTPYYELLPRLWNGKGDAVSRVIRYGKPLLLKDYQVRCFFGLSQVDVEITPLSDGSAKVSGALVTLTEHAGCSLFQDLQRSQTLIDIGKVSVTLAHGVRNPLNAIKGAVVYLKERYRAEATFLEFEQIIEEEITKLDHFISRFLSTSFLDREMIDTDVNALLEKVAKMTSLQARAGKVNFVQQFAEVPMVRIDSFQLEHAFLNVINNSLEAMPEGGSITLRTSCARKNQTQFVVVDITDTGLGMASKELLLPRKKEAVVKGKGFGLFITREIVRYHAGHIEIINGKRAGTTIRIHLPVELQGGVS